MNNKKIYLILIVLLILALGLLGAFWYLSQNKNQDQPTTVENTQNNFNEPTVNQEQPTPKPVVSETPVSNNLTAEEKEQAQLLKLAGSFVERYGSYSNQTDFENLSDLLPFMSRDLKNWAENFIKEKRKSIAENQPYYGLTTKTLKKELVSFSDDLVKIKVSVQKSEMIGGDFNAKVFYEDYLVELIKEDEIWKIDKVGK